MKHHYEKPAFCHVTKRNTCVLALHSNLSSCPQIFPAQVEVHPSKSYIGVLSDPTPLLINWFRQIIQNFIKTNQDTTSLIASVDNFVQNIVIRINLAATLPYFTVLLYASVFLGAISFLMICFQTYNYIREKRICLHSGYELPQDKF